MTRSMSTRLALIRRERAVLLGHFGGGGISHAGHQRGDGAAQRAAFAAVVGQATGHEQSAQVGVAEAQSAERVGALGDFLRWELRHQHRDFQRDGPQAHAVLEAGHIERAGLIVPCGTPSD